MSNINTAARRKQWVVTGVSVAVALGIGGGVWAYTYHQSELKAQPKPKVVDMTGGVVTSSFTDNMATSALTQQQNKTSALENSMNQLKTEQQQQNEQLKQQLSKLMDAMSKLQSMPPAVNTPPTNAPTSPGVGGNGPVPSGPPGPAQWSVTTPNRGPATGQGNQFYPGQSSRQAAAFYPGTGSGHLGGLTSKTFSYTSLQAKKTKLPWIPSGSFSEAVMIEGADANASVTGQQNTSPVVITLIGDVSMPNGKTYNMDQCRVTGEIWGDISSERGEVRTKNISCIMKNGKHIDMPFDGHVAYQGKQGVRGKPVMRNGQIIGYAGAAGLLSGFGEGIKSAATPTVGFGATSSVSAGDVVKEGIGGGASKAADTLSQYWIKRAEQYHPVIDIGAGNLVTVVFQQGFRLETIEDVEMDKDKKTQGTVQQAATNTATQANNVTRAAVLNPDEVLRQASQLKLGDTIN
jgi:conjugal transfer pilus assembly protein TraB